MEVRHGSRAGARPIPDVAPPAPDEDPRPRHTKAQLGLRVLGAVAVLVVGAVHLEQYFAVHYRVVPVIGPLFLLNFIGATALGLLLLSPAERLVDRTVGRGGSLVVALLALSAIGLAVTSFVFLFVSESTTLFGFHEYGYRAAIVISLSAEAATAVFLGGYLLGRLRRSS